MRPVLSIGIIFKDNIRCLERCLRSLEPLRKAIPCELVMADTGSMDGSRKVAETYADILIDFPWVNDFAAARNAVMDRCTGKWHLTIDADEWLDADFSELSRFLRLNSSEQYTAGYIVQRNLLDPEDDNQYSDHIGGRLLNMDSGLRYEGAVHETWPIQPEAYCCMLKNVVLWHDGYIASRQGKGNENTKSIRNLALLEKQLEEEPDNYRYLVEALDSSYTAEIGMYFALKAMDLIHSGKNETGIMEAILYRDCIQTATKANSIQFEDWLREAQVKYPDIIYILVDVNYLAAEMASESFDWKNCVQYGEAYFRGLRAYQEDITGMRYNMLAGPLNTSDRASQEKMWMMVSEAYAHLGKWEMCRKYLLKCTPDCMSVRIIKRWVQVAFFAWEHIELSDIFQKIGKTFSESAQLDDRRMWMRKEQFIKSCKQLLAYEMPKDGELKKIYPKQAAYPLLLKLGECDLSYAAQIMLADNPEKVMLLASKILNWTDFPAELLAKTIKTTQWIPEGFYHQSVRRLEELALKLADKIKTSEHLKFLKLLPRDTMKQRVFQYDLSIALVRNLIWTTQHEREIWSTWKYYSVGSRYFLQSYYNPDVLENKPEESLPDMHGFGWCCAGAWMAKSQEEYIKWLRKALACAPVMKSMVTFLMDHADDPRSRQPSQELQDLAEQIRGLLSTLPPNDPAVKELKSSDLYRNISYLIE